MHAHSGLATIIPIALIRSMNSPLAVGTIPIPSDWWTQHVVVSVLWLLLTVHHTTEYVHVNGTLMECKKYYVHGHVSLHHMQRLAQRAMTKPQP